MAADVPCRHTCDTRRSLPILGPLQVHNPATGETLASVSHCKGSETRAAIAEASSVFKSWAAKTGKERSQILRKYVPLGVWITEGGGVWADVHAEGYSRPKRPPARLKGEQRLLLPVPRPSPGHTPPGKVV